VAALLAATEPMQEATARTGGVTHCSFLCCLSLELLLLLLLLMHLVTVVKHSPGC
jgi:hypothetical protein